MYAYLQGKFTLKNPAQVYLDIHGVGYEVNISLNTYAQIQDLEQGKLYTYLQIKEDGHTLFGFFDKTEKEIFIHLKKQPHGFVQDRNPQRSIQKT